MELEYIKEVCNFIKDIFNVKSFDVPILLFNLCIIFFISLLYYDVKIKNLFSETRLILLMTLVCLVDFIAECIIGNIIFIIPIVSFFLVQLFLLIKDKNLFDYFSPKKKKEKRDKENDEYNELNFKIKKLGKESGFDLLDILYIYDYITDYQRRKVIQNLIYDDIDDMIRFLNTHPTVSDEELMEARAILNLIELNGKIVTKQEATFYLLDNSTCEAEVEDRKKEEK